MDTQSKVAVTALSTIKHGTEDGLLVEYNAGDKLELTINQAAQLMAVGVVEVSDQVQQAVEQAVAKSEVVAETQQTADPSADEIAATLTSVEK